MKHSGKNFQVEPIQKNFPCAFPYSTGDSFIPIQPMACETHFSSGYE
jgi:hypothetical protein